MSTIMMPSEVVEAYQQAQASYVRWEDENREWTREMLEDFKDVLYEIVRAANEDQPEIQARHKMNAIEILSDIYQEGEGAGLARVSAPQGDVVLPDSLISLHDAAHDAYLTYADTVRKPIGGIISSFRDALDHLIDAADESTPQNEHLYSWVRPWNICWKALGNHSS